MKRHRSSSKGLGKAFGTVLREHRQRRSLSQEELAMEADLARNYVSMLERGLRKPSLEAVFALAAALEVTPTRLVADVWELVSAD